MFFHTNGAHPASSTLALMDRLSELCPHVGTNGVRDMLRQSSDPEPNNDYLALPCNIHRRDIVFQSGTTKRSTLLNKYHNTLFPLANFSVAR